MEILLSKDSHRWTFVWCLVFGVRCLLCGVWRLAFLVSRRGQALFLYTRWRRRRRWRFSHQSTSTYGPRREQVASFCKRKTNLPLLLGTRSMSRTHAGWSFEFRLNLYIPSSNLFTHHHIAIYKKKLIYQTKSTIIDFFFCLYFLFNE